MKNPKLKNALSLIGLALVFVAPMYLAQYVFRNTDDYVSSTTNRGELISPVLALSDLQLTDKTGEPFTSTKWLLFYFAGSHCKTDCEKILNMLHRVHVALGARQERVSLVVATKQTPVAELPAQVLLYSKDVVLAPETIYLVDPQGNIMLRYPATSNPRDVYEDIKHLLKITKLG